MELPCRLWCFACTVGTAGEGHHHCWQHPWHLGHLWPQSQSVTSLAGSHLIPPRPGSLSWVTTVECNRGNHFSHITPPASGGDFKQLAFSQAGLSICRWLCLHNQDQKHPAGSTASRKAAPLGAPHLCPMGCRVPWRPAYDNFPARPPAKMWVRLVGPEPQM